MERKVYWVIPVGFAKNVFGPIVYHNLAGNLLGMTLAAAFYQVLIHSRQQGICTSVAQLRLRRWQWPDVATQVRWTVLAVNVAGLLLTLSRGALLSAIAAIVVALVWMRPRKGWAGITIPLGVALVSALALIGWFRASDAISDRYETLMQSERLMEDVRLQHWQDGIRAGKAYGTTGVGLGAYRHIHLLFQDHEIERVFLRAHQQYLETWVDSGLIGLFLLLAVIAGTTISLFWLSRRRERELRAAATLGIVLLVGQLAHACLDFCLYLPASAIMFAGLLGAIFGIAAEAASDRGANRWWLGLPLVMPMRWAAPIVIVAGCGWSAWAGATWAREEAALYDANWNDSQFDTPVKDIQRWIGQLEEFAPGTDDWRIPLALGELYVTDYRHAVLRELNKELTPEQKEALSQQELWDFTDPMVLNARANLMAHEDNFAGIDEEMRTQPLIVERLALAHEQYRWCRKNCPLIAQAHLRLAELMFLRKTPDYDDYRDLEHAAVLAVGNPDVQYEVGRRFANAGQDERALIAWRESLRLSNRRWFAIYDLVGNQLTPKQILEQLLPPNDPQLLLSIAGRFLTEQEQAASRKLYLDRAEQILGNKPPASRDQRSAWHLNRAELCLLRDDRKQAIDEIAAAVRLKPDDHALRAQLAQQLALEERWTEALQEARYCLNLQPNNWDYKNLYANIEQGPKGEAEKHE